MSAYQFGARRDTVDLLLVDEDPKREQQSARLWVPSCPRDGEDVGWINGFLLLRLRQVIKGSHGYQKLERVEVKRLAKNAVSEPEMRTTGVQREWDTNMRIWEKEEGGSRTERKETRRNENLAGRNDFCIAGTRGTEKKRGGKKLGQDETRGRLAEN